MTVQSSLSFFALVVWTGLPQSSGLCGTVRTVSISWIRKQKCGEEICSRSEQLFLIKVWEHTHKCLWECARNLAVCRTQDEPSARDHCPHLSASFPRRGGHSILDMEFTVACTSSAWFQPILFVLGLEASSLVFPARPLCLFPWSFPRCSGHFAVLCLWKAAGSCAHCSSSLVALTGFLEVGQCQGAEPGGIPPSSFLSLSSWMLEAPSLVNPFLHYQQGWSFEGWRNVRIRVGR